VFQRFLAEISFDTPAINVGSSYNKEAFLFAAAGFNRGKAALRPSTIYGPVRQALVCLMSSD
jgi:hypothetical protein